LISKIKNKYFCIQYFLNTLYILKLVNTVQRQGLCLQKALASKFVKKHNETVEKVAKKYPKAYIRWPKL
jgi:hypothetical protein